MRVSTVFSFFAFTSPVRKSTQTKWQIRSSYGHKGRFKFTWKGLPGSCGPHSENCCSKGHNLEKELLRETEDLVSFIRSAELISMFLAGTLDIPFFCPSLIITSIIILIKICQTNGLYWWYVALISLLKLLAFDNFYISIVWLCVFWFLYMWTLFIFLSCYRFLSYPWCSVYTFVISGPCMFYILRIYSSNIFQLLHFCYTMVSFIF